MKKICILSFILLALFTASAVKVNAQVAKVISVGGEIGPSFAKFGQDANDQQFKSGLVAGGFLTYSVVNTFGVTLKALYSQKGTRFEDDGTSVKQILNYVEIPLIARYFLNKEGKFRPNVFLGPSAAVLLSAKTKRGNNEAVNVSDEQRRNFRDFDLGVTGGVGLNYLILNETRLLLDARYTYGLIDVANPGNINNNALAITFGMSFGI